MMKKILGGIGAVILIGLALMEEGGVERVLGELMGQQQTASSNNPGQSRPAEQTEGDFDYYVMALSWSPTYCEEKPDDRSAQCNGSRDYGFVLHGLWPQYETGWPQFCDVRAKVPDSTTDRMLRIMPAKGLIYHQWKKHGTCSGLDPRGYFETSERAFNSITIPRELQKLQKPLVIDPKVVEAAFIEANPNHGRDSITVTCNRKRLREVRICLDRALQPRRCGADVIRDCRDASVRMPPVR